jgi:hypothetical protein
VLLVLSEDDVHILKGFGKCPTEISNIYIYNEMETLS